MTRALLPFAAAMAAIVLASNILVQVVVGAYLTWGAFTYPLAFLVTDLVNRSRGPAAARVVVMAGFVAGVAFSLGASLVPAGAVPLTTFRIALGSGLAFLAGQMLDVAVFDRLRRAPWWQAPLLSSLLASALDTALFFSVAFAGAFAFLDPGDPNGWAREAAPLLGAGPEAPFWVSLAVADGLVKIALALLALVPYRLALGLLRA